MKSSISKTKSLWLSTITLLLVFVAGSSVACAQQTKKNIGSEAKPNNIIEIDATYLKEHIYDYEANPNQFVYKGDKPAIIDFYATWCGPCRALAPKLEATAKNNASNLVVYKIDIDKNPELATHFGIQSVPTLLFVPLKGMPYLSKGNLPLEYINQMVGKILPKEIHNSK